MNKIIFSLITAFCFISQGKAAPITHTSDFISDTSRTGFNGFESIPTDGTRYSGGAGPYSENEIVVEQINGDRGNEIWATYNFIGKQGDYVWYPNGGDDGYTSISLSGGVDFNDVGFNYGTGGGASLIIYQILDDGLTVKSGTADLSRTSANYLGFSGGGFDTILLRDNHFGASVNALGVSQALTIDNIEIRSARIPEPSSLALFALGIFGLFSANFKRQKAREIKVITTNQI